VGVSAGSKGWAYPGRGIVESVRSRLEKLLLWRAWERMLEIEFVDRSVALAGKAFVSFFPLVIVVASFLPAHMRSNIFTTLTHRLGIRGSSLNLSKQAFASANDVRKATGVAGLIFTIFFASSFTTALQRVYLRTWRRPRDLKVGSYTRGLSWLIALLVYMAIVGTIGRAMTGDVGIGIAVVIAIALSIGWWTFTAWYLLLGHVRWRVLVPTGAITALAMIGYALSANVWMPETVTSNTKQFGFFGVALALVTWFSGASICILASACVGAILVQDTGRTGELLRGGGDTLVPGAPPPLEAPTQALRLRDAFAPLREDAG
jgi:membrane protein